MEIPTRMFAGHRRRLAERLRQRGVPADAVVLLQGGEQIYRYWTDHEPAFRQESFFYYLFGVKEPGWFGTVDVGSARCTLFLPRLPSEYAVWQGTILAPSHFQQEYGVEEVRYVDEMAEVLAKKAPSSVLVLRGINTDSKLEHQPASFLGLERFAVDDKTLHPELVECRVFKDADELEVLRYVNRISSAAHVEVMRACRAGMSEYQLEALFQYFAYRNGGCRFTAYTCICCSGEHGSVLHYGHAALPNLGSVRDGDMLLLDMGAEYCCHVSDITCSFPATGKFTERQKGIYNAVLDAQQSVENAMKPGVSWFDMHRLAERVIAQHLLQLGLLRGKLEDILAAHIPALFMPHGLGHLMGLDTHDVGGYPQGTHRIDEPGIRSLRSGRTLEANMVLTVEPGVYFITALLEPAFKNSAQAPFLNEALIREYFDFGGVRLEDDVVVTEHGMELMTKVPRTVEDIEKVMSGGEWII